MGGKRFGVLLCAEDSEYVKTKYGGYFGVFVEMLAEEGETWDMFRVVAGEFPDDKEIDLYDGFVITGSCNDAHGNDVWICKLLNLIKKLNSMKKRLLGICFGHQILGRALGGRIGRANSGWDIGITTIYLSSPVHTSSSSSKVFPSTFDVPTAMSVIECHQDEMLELPPKAEVIAWSKKTGIEMFKHGDNIMGIQGHPEYTKDILLHLVDRLLQRKLISEDYANDVKARMDACEPDRKALKQLCISFFKGRL